MPSTGREKRVGVDGGQWTECVGYGTGEKESCLTWLGCDVLTAKWTNARLV